jgi:DinB superfamily
MLIADSTARRQAPGESARSMEPTGRPSPAEVRDRLRQQLGECLTLLERLGGGARALCRVTMTVNGLGKIDLYQWRFFLAQHARRHLQQMAAIAVEFESRAVGVAYWVQLWERSPSWGWPGRRRLRPGHPRSILGAGPSNPTLQQTAASSVASRLGVAEGRRC